LTYLSSDHSGRTRFPETLRLSHETTLRTDSLAKFLAISVLLRLVILIPSSDLKAESDVVGTKNGDQIGT
jgi:hypothetical protein